MEISGIGEKMVQKIAAAVKQHFEPEPEPAAEAAAALAAAPGEGNGNPGPATEESDVAETADAETRSEG